MQLTNTALLFLAASITTAAPFQKRTAAIVLTDLSTISDDVATLTTAALSYSGGLVESLTLAATVNKLETAITTATTDTSSSTAFSSTESDSLLAAVNTLTPNIVALLDDLDAKASVISKAGYTSLVGGALTTLTTDTDALFAALEAKVDADDQAALGALQVSVDEAFATSSGIF